MSLKTVVQSGKGERKRLTMTLWMEVGPPLRSEMNAEINNVLLPHPGLRKSSPEHLPPKPFPTTGAMGQALPCVTLVACVREHLVIKYLSRSKLWTPDPTRLL